MKIWKALIAVTMICLLIGGTWSMVDAQSGSQGGGEIYLPVINGGSGVAGPSPTPILLQTDTPTPTQTPTATPTPTTAPGIPNGVPSVNGVCDLGMHLVHKSGTIGIANPDDFDPAVDSWNDYLCVPNESAEALTCSEHGTAGIIDGVAVCACDDGFAGANCELTTAMPDTPTVRLNGTANSLEHGDVVELSASAIGQVQSAGAATGGVATGGVATGSLTTTGLWRIDAADGCLLASRDSAECLTEYQGATVFFRASTESSVRKTAGVQFSPPAGPPIFETVIVQPPGYIPVSGYGRPQLEPVRDEFEEFMKSRCAGAGLIGISHYGNPVAVWGLGKIHGRASSVIFNPDCPSDAIDPHYPQAPNVSYTSPFKIGSVSKTVMYAAGRWALKNRLQELDTDVDVVAPSPNRLVTAIRNAAGNLQLDSWDVNGAGVQAHLGSTETGVARDFSITALSNERIAGAVRTHDNNAKVIVWSLDANGDLARLGDVQINGVKRVSVATVSPTRLVAALTLSDDTVKMIVWDIALDGSLIQRGLGAAGRARAIDIVDISTDSQDRVVTAVSTNDYRLKIIVWNIIGGGAINRGDDLEIPTNIQHVALEALSDSRLVAAMQTDADELRVQVVAVSPAGTLTQQDAQDVGEIDNLALSRIGPSGFSTVVRKSNGTFRLHTWTVDSAGDLTQRNDGTAGVIGSAALANIIYAGGDTFNSILFSAVRTAESTLKIIPWNVTGPTPQRLDDAIAGDPIADYPWSDGDIEALSLFGYDMPEGLLPPQLDRAFGGKVQLPTMDPPIGGVVIDDDSSCEALTDFADPQWKDVQLKHIFAHRTGLPRSAISYNSIMQNYLDEWRGLNSRADYAAQETLLRMQWGASNVEHARTILGWDALQTRDSAGYLVPGATLDEVLMTVAARCLPMELGEYRYSNTDPSILRRIVEHIMGVPYAADVPMPNMLAQHEGSILQQFFQSELGIETSATDGIFAAAVAVNSASDGSEPGPTARGWDDDKEGTQKVYPKGWDRKRPHCIMTDDGNSCSFNAWAGPSPTNPDPARTGRINWYWENEEVRLPYWSQGSGAATGGLRVEAYPFLKFMSNYWVGSYGENPSIGEPRNSTWSLLKSHNGSLGGGYAYAIQLGGTGGCAGAEGVDVIVAVNQNSDKTGQAYNALYSTIRNALCDVDWTEVEPYPIFSIVE